MSRVEREAWNVRNRGKPPGGAEQFVIDMIPLLPAGGRILDLAAGRGRHALALAHAGMRVVALDYSDAAMVQLRSAAPAKLEIAAVAADATALPFRPSSFDGVVNVNFLERAAIPALIAALRIGGALLFDTFLIDQREFGHPRDPRFMLEHYELRALLGAMELARYREGLVVDPYGTRSWRAQALAFKRE